MADLKKKFIDILFEDEIDEDELQDDSSYFERKYTKQTQDNPIKAKDILYRKSSTSPFLDLDEKKTKKESYTPSTPIMTREEYEMSSQISPIFGLIKDNKPKTESSPRPEITKAQTNKPLDSHLDIITSPIYGYANKEDAANKNYNVKGINREEEEVELHNLFDEEETLNQSYKHVASETENKEETDDDEISLFRLFGDNQ